MNKRIWAFIGGMGVEGGQWRVDSGSGRWPVEGGQWEWKVDSGG